MKTIKSNIKKLKGTSRTTKDYITFDYYKNCLFNSKIFEKNNHTLRRTKHDIFLEKQDKLNLNNFVDKNLN